MNDDLTKLESSSEEESFANNQLPREGINPEKTRVSIDLDSEVLNRIKHLTNDPSKIIETAIKQWLNGERDGETDLTRTFRRNPPVPPQGEWND
ncbi:hypothetical protein [Waterburya agarophytonicola]|uniref:hypothetical protein n=1 Tax=Waterburya agarophytonicola TaxID=2886916 RepID=UPI001E30A9FF|nr:hypothetical protein [Waterburya agarophytonicola]